MTPAERLEAAGQWLAAAGGQAASGELGAALQLNHARQADVVKAMREQGLVEGPRGQVQLTAAGWSRFGGATSSTSTGGAGQVLDRVLAAWPYQHRAFLELLVSAVVARRHLGASHPAGHLGFMALGQTGTGKSAMGTVVCHLFGWPLEEHLVHVPAESTGSLLGRRSADPAGEGWRWEPAPATALPFVLLDEFDKAPKPVQDRAWLYFDGKRRVQLEGTVHELHATPLLTANPPADGDRHRHLRPEYRRRSVVLDTATMAGRGREFGQLMRQLAEQTSPRDRLALDRLTPPDRLHDDARAVLDSVYEVLTDAGREEWDSRGLELATLGRCALLGAGADQQLAAWSTAVAYLHATESRPGQVRERWSLDLRSVREHLGEGVGVDALVAAIERGRQGQEQARAVVRSGRQRQARAELDALEGGAALAARCKQLQAQLDGRKVLPEQYAEAAGLRRVLSTVARRAGQVSTAASLREVQEQAADPLARGAQLVSAAAAARQQRVTDAATERLQVAEDRRAARQHAAVARAQAAAAKQTRAHRLAAVVAAAKPLEALYARRTTRPEENPLTVLARVRVDGYDQPLLRYIAPPPPEQPTGSLRARLAHRLRSPAVSGRWEVTGSSLAFAGSSVSCAALSQWGPHTRAVLAPALAALHAQEDQLRTGRPRQGRPRVDPATDARTAALGSAAPRLPGAAVARR